MEDKPEEGLVPGHGTNTISGSYSPTGSKENSLEDRREVLASLSKCGQFGRSDSRENTCSNTDIKKVPECNSFSEKYSSDANKNGRVYETNDEVLRVKDSSEREQVATAVDMAVETSVDCAPSREDKPSLQCVDDNSAKTCLPHNGSLTHVVNSEDWENVNACGESSTVSSVVNVTNTITRAFSPTGFEGNCVEDRESVLCPSSQSLTSSSHSLPLPCVGDMAGNTSTSSMQAEHGISLNMSAMQEHRSVASGSSSQRLSPASNENPPPRNSPAGHEPASLSHIKTLSSSDDNEDSCRVVFVKPEPVLNIHDSILSESGPSSLRDGACLQSGLHRSVNLEGGNVSSISHIGTTHTEKLPCKVLTKYVFIPCRKQRKKKFGLLYRKLFHHSYDMKTYRKSSSIEALKRKKNRVKRKKCFQSHKLPQESNKEYTSISSNPLRDSARDQILLQQRRDERANRRINREAKKNVDVAVKKKNKPKVTNEKSKHSSKITKRKILYEKNSMEKRKPLRLEDKVEIIWAMEGPGATLASVAEDFEVTSSTVKGILKIKDSLLEMFEGQDVMKREKKVKIKKKVSQTQEAEKNERKEESELTVKVEAGGEGQGNVEDMLRAKSASAGIPQSDCGLLDKKVLRKDLTLEEKVKVIHALEIPGRKIVSLAKEYGVSVSSISRINKNKHFILSKSASGDLSFNQRRSRNCNDPQLDRVLLRWYRALQSHNVAEKSFSISNTLLKDKARDLVIAMGKNYFPSDNWIMRWKNRHNLMSKSGMLSDREELSKLDSRVDLKMILEGAAAPDITAEMLEKMKKETGVSRHGGKPEEFLICEHCGVLTSNKKNRKENNHVVGCPASAYRKDLTLEEKLQVVRALERPGVKMISLAKKYGVSASAISRIHKNRVDILARCASGNVNSSRRRERGSKEPEVEKVLYEWFRVQQEMGIHVSGSMIREKAKDIARVMGKEFWPSDSWVFRWRHRNNVSALSSVFDEESDEANSNTSPAESLRVGLELQANGTKLKEEEDGEEAEKGLLGNERKMTPDTVVPAEKKLRLPRSVMCEKCGFVSSRLKNNRIKNLRHAKGCPDLKPRNELTYENRAKMLKALEEPGATLSSVARHFGVSVSSMSRMNQKKDAILSHGIDHGNQKRIRECKEPEVASSLYQWFMEKKAEGVHVTGPTLKEKAQKLAADMGREFKASCGWLGRWRHRYNVTGTTRSGDKIQRDPLKKKRLKKTALSCVDEAVEQNVLQSVFTDLHHSNNDSAASAAIIADPASSMATPHASAQSVFIPQRYQTPWEMNQQQMATCVWPKDFMNPSQGSSGLHEENLISYPYAEAAPTKPVFHMFDSFSTMGYQVPLTVESAGMVGGRDYPKVDQGDKSPAHTHQHVPTMLAQHSQPGQTTHPATMPHLTYHPVGTHQHTHILPHHQPPLHSTLATTTPSCGPAEEDPDQQREVMEAFKIMSSFVQKKSLGDQVQAALRTIEMSMKNPVRKSADRNSFASI